MASVESSVRDSASSPGWVHFVVFLLFSHNAWIYSPEYKLLAVNCKPRQKVLRMLVTFMFFF